MSERTYALMNLRKFIKQRALARKKWKPLPDMPEHMIFEADPDDWDFDDTWDLVLSESE